MKKIINLCLLLSSISAYSAIACDLRIESKLDLKNLSRAEKLDLKTTAKAKGFSLRFDQESDARYVLDLTNLKIKSITTNSLRKQTCFLFSGSTPYPCLKSVEVETDRADISGKGVLLENVNAEENDLALIDLNEKDVKHDTVSVIGSTLNKLPACSNI